MTLDPNTIRYNQRIRRQSAAHTASCTWASAGAALTFGCVRFRPEDFSMTAVDTRRPARSRQAAADDPGGGAALTPAQPARESNYN
jgi:hypothetical protein